MQSHHSNYLHRRITPAERHAHDRAFLRTLIFLMIVCVIVMIVGKRLGYGQPISQDEPSQPSQPKAQSQATASPQATQSPAKANPEHSPEHSPEQVNPASAQTAPKAASVTMYVPDPSESTSLALAQDEAIIAQQAWNAASLKLPEYTQFNLRVNDIYDWCRKVISKHKWDKDADGKPSGVTCNVNVKPVEFGKQATATGQVQTPK